MTQPQLYTIITLVIAVSGATYAALYALRNFLRDKIVVAAKDCENYITPIRDSRNESLIDLGNAKYQAAQRWLICWRWSLGIPVVLFVAVAYWMALHLFWGCFDDPQKTSGLWWQAYRWLLLVLVGVDGICIIGTAFSSWRIRANVHELERVFKGVSRSSIT